MAMSGRISTLSACRRARPLTLVAVPWLGLLLAWGATDAARAAVPQKAGETTETEQPDVDPPTEEETAELKTLEAMELPSFERLMQGPAIDWIVIIGKKVLEVEPLYPRPGTIEDLKSQIAALLRANGGGVESDAARRKRLAKYLLPVTLLEGEEREYRLHIDLVKEIIYYEDLMLRRIDRLLDENDVRRAYELVTALDQRQDNWSGAAARRDRLTFVESQLKFAAGRTEEALALLESLHERSPAYPGLDDQFRGVVDKLVGEALARDDPRQARYFLRRLQEHLPGHKSVAAGTARLQQAARELVSQSVASEREGQIARALDLAEQGARTWPELPELLPVYNRLASRHQRLRVGVVDLPRGTSESAAAVLRPGELRRRRLSEVPLFQAARFEDKIARYESRCFQEWNPTELGHRVDFRLRSAARRAESLPQITAAGLGEALAERLDSGGDRYDARIAAIVKGMSVGGPFDLTVQFDQAPLRPEALFAFPYRPARSRALLPPETDPAPGPAPGSDSFPFRLEPLAGDVEARYRRAISEPDRSADRRIAEIIETRYPSHEKAIQGLLRGEVSLLPAVPGSTVRSFSARNEFFTQPYGLPVTHVLQFHPRHAPARSRALRRALVYAIDRQQLLNELFLGGADESFGRLATAPWATSLYAYDRFLKPHPFDPALAFSLARNATKELGGNVPPLRLWVADAPDLRAAARRIVAAWDAIGVPAELIADAPPPGIESDDWDVAYRAEVMAEPIVELWPYLSLSESTETTALSHLPTWLRHDLLELDRVGDWRTAEQLLNKLHRQFWAEAYVIPLWEIDEHFVVRKNVRNVPDRPLGPYQAIERWKIEPWYSRD